MCRMSHHRRPLARQNQTTTKKMKMSLNAPTEGKVVLTAVVVDDSQLDADVVDEEGARTSPDPSNTWKPSPAGSAGPENVMLTSPTGSPSEVP